MKGKVISFFQSAKKKAAAIVVGGATAVGTSAIAFAQTPGAGADPLPVFNITNSMLTPLVEGVIANVGVILPVGLGLFAVFLGIRLIPGLISSFVRMR